MKTTTIRRSVVEITVLAMIALLAVIGLQRANAATVGGFEIDGNLANSTALDWDSAAVAPQPINSDGIENNDQTGFKQGSQENDPDDWVVEQHKPTGKDDIGYNFGYAQRVSGHEWVFVGFERVATNGTTRFIEELNQKPNKINANGVSVPDRSDGDLRLLIEQQGGENFGVDGTIDRWENGAWVNLTPPGGSIDGASNSSEIDAINGNDPIAGADDKLDPGQFAEIAFDITAINEADGTTCRSAAFVVVNGRSQASKADNPELKDYINPINVNIPPDCTTLNIVKVGPDGTTPAPGATFTIEPNPETGTGGPVTVTDGEAAGGSNDLDDPDGDANGIVLIQAEPNHDYTVTETSPPPGYFLPNDTEVTHTAGSGATVEFKFTDPLGSVTFFKTDGESALCCAKFNIVATSGAALDEGVDINVTDNGANDEDGTAGTIQVVDLLKGGYDVTETEAPGGYDLDPTAKSFTVGPGQGNKDVTIEAAFVNTPVPDEPRLHLLKTNDPTGEVSVGDEITYTVSWWNDGGQPATQQTITDELPAGVEYVSDDGGATFDPNTGPSGTLTVGPVDIPNGTSENDPAGSFEVTVQVREGTEDTTLTNTAVLGDLESTVENPVAPALEGEMGLEKSVEPEGDAQYGDELTYTLVATALGDIDQHNAVVSDEVPEGTTYVDGSADCVGLPCTASYDDAERTVSWALGDIAAGASRVVSFDVTIDVPDFNAEDGAAATTIVNVGSVTTDEDPETPSNEVITPVTEVLGETVVRPPNEPEVAPTELPFTGQPFGEFVLVAMALLGTGIVLRVAGMRRAYVRRH